MWRRYAQLLGVQMRASFQQAVAYRLDFLVEAFTAVFWAASTLVPLFVLFGEREQVAGWTFAESRLVLAFFLLLKAFIEGAISPSLMAVVEHIRKGTLDFVLIKPADAQFLVSTSKFEPSAVIGAGAAVALLGWSLWDMGHVPDAAGVATMAVLLGCSVLLLYSLWILFVSAAFYVVRVDNLSYLLTSVFDAARWPVSVFRGTLRAVFTWVVPLALMTTFPAEALLGRFTAAQGVVAVAGTLVFAFLARRVWIGALGKYTSASS